MRDCHRMRGTRCICVRAESRESGWRSSQYQYAYAGRNFSFLGTRLGCVRESVVCGVCPESGAEMAMYIQNWEYVERGKTPRPEHAEEA